ncbi:hypothetical protein R50073_42020 [Maricurvus nonylphenolicus]|uniref:DUF4034 domain-containing protein n=1 Tax=Maricurvus nonylphenolicus TaxID=1008307 RepID=UPI0036F33357
MRIDKWWLIFSFAAIAVITSGYIWFNTDRSILVHRDLLQAREFSRLDKSLEQQNDDYLNGKISLKTYYWGIETVWPKQDTANVKQLLDDWLKANPSSAYAHLFLAQHWFQEAGKARGEKWAKDTTKQQFDEMEKLLAKASPHLNKAIELNPLLLKAHADKLLLIRGSSKHGNASEYFAKIPERLKQSPFIWLSLLRTAYPRWGGSYHEMVFIIHNEIPKHAPNINKAGSDFLQDAIIFDLLRVEMENKSYTAALILAEERIDNGTQHSDIYWAAAKAAAQIGAYKNCITYAKIATEMRPWRSNLWGKLGYCADKEEKWDIAKNAYRHKLFLDGYSAYDLFMFGRAYMHLYQFNEAYRLFKTAEELDRSFTKYTTQFTDYIEEHESRHIHSRGKTLEDMIGTITYDPNTADSSEINILTESL